MRKIYVLDTTLRDGEQSPGVSLTAQEKVEIALQLERLGIDRIEAGFPITSKGEIASIQAVAKVIKQATLVAFSRSKEQDIDAAREALKGAEDACLHIFLATSPIHREYKLKMSKEKVLDTLEAAIQYGRKYFSKIEFSAEDASRTEVEFLCQVTERAIKAGATIVNLPDTVGFATPDMFGQMFKTIRENVTGIERIQLSTHCHDDLGMATANTLAAIANGVEQFEGTINGIGERAGNTAVEEVALALETRSDVYQAKTSMVLHEVYQTSRMVSKLTGMLVPGNKAIVGANAFAHESGIHQDGMLKNRATYEIITPATIGVTSSKLVLGKHSGRHAFKERLIDMGYHLDEEQLNTAFAKFKELADRKKEIVTEDIRALIDERAKEGPVPFQLDQLHISFGNHSIPTASVRLLTEQGDVMEDCAIGGGTIDAVYRAIEKATGFSAELEDYQIHSVTQGKDALGEVHVILHQGDMSSRGRGVSTDIIEASAKAYVEAINRLVVRQREPERDGNISLH
ncbi:2-isopropylmalate synthase [Paenibacillus shirakamiensis]|uniref:2-isopropylmalate synthase n=1 Tax=Paenibacillus shirakamiensis TaxID=1265935 RepID=A0ABS4JDR0_9BACL|nr:2-isopropylmalate synthase [Paenibacillus shirakamiensis]MBP1999853.1 2-isopropylmalate synthase [Paenibacillus shirakamiensis]